MNSLLEELSRAISDRLTADNKLNAVNIKYAQMRIDLEKEKSEAQIAFEMACRAELIVFRKLEQSLMATNRHNPYAAHDIMFDALAATYSASDRRS